MYYLFKIKIYDTEYITNDIVHLRKLFDNFVIIVKIQIVYNPDLSLYGRGSDMRGDYIEYVR